MQLALAESEALESTCCHLFYEHPYPDGLKVRRIVYKNTKRISSKGDCINRIYQSEDGDFLRAGQVKTNQIIQTDPIDILKSEIKSASRSTRRRSSSEFSARYKTLSHLCNILDGWSMRNVPLKFHEMVQNDAPAFRMLFQQAVSERLDEVFNKC